MELTPTILFLAIVITAVFCFGCSILFIRLRLPALQYILSFFSPEDILRAVKMGQVVSSNLPSLSDEDKIFNATLEQALLDNPALLVKEIIETDEGQIRIPKS